MEKLNFSDISAMKGNGSSMRTVLKSFIDKGATIYLLHEDTDKIIERFFLVRYEELTIPLRAYNLNFYSTHNSALSLNITNDKLRSKAFLEAWNIPTPDTLFYTDNNNAENFLNKYSSCVVKPRIGSHGDGITVGVKDKEDLYKAIKQAQTIHPKVLLQQQITGDDHRLLFIDYKFVAAVKRSPAYIIGDGVNTIREIVEQSNAQKSIIWENIRNGVTSADDTRGSISKTPIDEIIAARGENILNQVPALGVKVQLLDKANVSLGGQTEDITDLVNHELTYKLSKMLKNIDLPLCGVDVLSTNISSSLDENNSYVIELNAAPGLRLHELPTEGKPRHVCEMVADSLIQHFRNLD
jgi:cyanophycin synthetase